MTSRPSASRPASRRKRRWLVAGIILWAVSLALAAGGLALARQVLDRGVAYGETSAQARRDRTIRAVNVQLELEPDLDSVARVLDLARAAGFGWVRQQVSWADIEPGHKGNFWDFDADRPTWARWDAIARLAAERNLQVIARLELPPDWARPAGTYKSHPPTNVRDYSDFVAVFTSRYREEITHVQLWNEPNLAEEWGRRPVDAGAYVELLRAGFAGARRGNPRATVVSASLAQTLEPDLETSAGLDDLAYLDRMYRLGAAPFLDVVAANAYGLWTGPGDRRVGAGYTNLPRILLVRDVMARHGDGAKPLWVSEFGWNAQPTGWQGRPSPWGQVDEATQAAHLLGSYRRATREWPWMGPMAVWLLRHPRAAPDDPTTFFALVRDDWSPRPAYDALLSDRATPVLAPGTWPDDAGGLEYVGTWQRSTRASGDTLHETPAPNAHLRLRFEGTRIELESPVGPTRGVAYVTVDGSYLLAGQLARNRFGQAMIDFGAPVARDGVRIPVAAGLPDGTHRLELTVSGDAGTGSTAPGVGIDAIIVARDRATAPETILAGAGAMTVLAGGWATRRAIARGIHVVATVAGALMPASLASRLGRIDPASWSALAVAAILPFATVMIPTPAGRFSVVEVAALAAVALAVTRAAMRAGLPRPYAQPTVPRLLALDGAVWAAILVLVGGTIGAVVAAYPNPAWREWRLLVAEPVAWYLVARAATRHAHGARRLAWALVAGATFAGLHALVQAATGIGVVGAEGVDRARALASSPNNLALLLDRVLPLAVALALASGATTSGAIRGVGRTAMLAWGAAVVIGAGLAVTWSRGGWIAGAGALAILAVRLGLVPAFARRRRVVAVAAIALAVVIAGAATTGRVQSLVRDDGTGILRLSVWRSALEMIRDHPWTGLGLDQFVYAYPRYLQPGAWREPNLSHPHQFVLDLWLRLGPAGLLALVALAWGTWRRDRRAAATGMGDPVLRLGAIAALGAVAIHGLVDNSYFVLDLAYATWAIVLVHRGASEGRPPSDAA